MNLKKRTENEKEFDAWEEIKDGGRIYFFEIAGKYGWKSKYLKEVDGSENTVRFWQEIFDENNMLREFHNKYPFDEGHKKI